MEKRLTNYQYNLKNKYHENLINNRKTSTELNDFIKRNFNVIDISKKDNIITKEKLQFKLNCLASWYNNGNLLSDNDLVLNSYIIVKDSKSDTYYQNFEQGYLKNYIYVIIESETGYVSSNCDKLNNELHLYRGISDSDIINNSPDLFLYLELLNEKLSNTNI